MTDRRREQKGTLRGRETARFVERMMKRFPEKRHARGRGVGDVGDTEGEVEQEVLIVVI